MQNFSELPISQYLKGRIASAGFSIPTPVQAAAIPPALEGKDILATAQTGTGKTLAFLIPVMEQQLQRNTPSILALVLVPTRELAMQIAEQYNALRGKQLPPAALVVGGLAERQQLAAVRNGAQFVVATPGRLEDYLNRKLIRFGELRVLVLDEVDRMLDMGFIPAVRRIAAVLPKQRQTMCFSATLESSVARLVDDYMKKPVRVALGERLKPCENVSMQAFEVALDQKQDLLQHLLAKETGRCLVFARTKRGTERLAINLARQGFAAAMIHGNRTQSQRTAALSGFQQGRYRVLVATDVASRGIHVQDIAHVINYDLPEDPENFVHRVGRTGRAGGHGVATTLFARDQRPELLELERKLGIRMERMTGFDPRAKQDRQPARKPAPAPADRPWADADRPRSTSTSEYRIGRLPGEVLQTQMEG